jgi:transcription-repair coupling factor (superfamily II helicase)
MSLRPLVEIATENERVHALAGRVREAAAGGGEAVEARASAMLRPLLLATLLEDDRGLADRPALLVAADDRSARDLAADLRAYLAPRRVRFYPSRGTGYASHVTPPPHLVGLRIDALDSLGAEADAIVVASATALAEAVPDASLRPAGFAISQGEELELGAVADDLVAAGYERVEQVEERGQFAVRGGILDVFPATEERAVRIELFGDEVDSMRWFSTFTQRSLGDAERVELAPAAELDAEHRELAELAAIEAAEEGGQPTNIAELLPLEHFIAPLDLVPASATVVLAAAEEIEPALRDHWEDVTTAMHADDARRLYVEVAEPLAARAALSLTGAGEDDEDAFRAARAESPARSIKEAEGELEKLVRSGYRTVVAFESRGEGDRARYGLDRLDVKVLEGGRLSPEPGLSFAEARLREGFVSPELKLAVYPFRRLVHRRRKADERPPGAARGRLAFSELRVGDYVVHEDHGVARFAGFETREVGGITRDYLYLEYKGEDRVYVPTDQLAKLSRYVGAGGEPSLSALGGKRWQNLKARARKAAGALAGELLNLYAERRTRRGHAFAVDGEWQIEMETSFPYRETADQLEAIEAVKGDMESEQPMDRLVCGDVGFGKTEVALRAAVKAAADGKQVMMLTTILAQQHFGTFRERLADLPFRVEGISRLRSAAETKAVLKDFEAGKVDVLIGTHRLLSRDVRANDLGLVIVDEEQRFGVKQKELLRQLKLKVDVLALSATPIPRTLQMSLAGLRDISVIETPPEGRRPVRTYVGPYDEDLVRKAIERERERNGQAFVLHNRIDSLPEVTERLRGLVPGASFLEAHGQMEEGKLEETMLAFLRGEADCLVTTTIIESGLDIPTANTLIVERADQLGLSQAYQIRGRVGRSRERAFAYLLYPSAEALSEEAAARLSTLADHTELGSGFRIAMRDLDIRGAGNLLGDEQSGHVAAVGFELYCQMIDEAVAEGGGAGEDGEEAPEPVRLDVPVDAYLPASFVPFEAAKIDIHRRIVAARAPGELRAIRDELGDRFGPPPPQAENLLRLQRARIELGLAGARSVEFRGGKLSVTGVELDSTQAGVLAEQVEGAVYEWREQTAALRVAGDPEERLTAVLALADGLREARRSAEGATA